MGKGGNIQRVGARMLRRRHLSCWMTVNDVAVETRLTSRGSDYKSEIVIIRDLLTQSNGVCSICFDSRVTIQAQAPDIRKLGLAVSRIVFECLEP